MSSKKNTPFANMQRLAQLKRDIPGSNKSPAELSFMASLNKAKIRHCFKKTFINNSSVVHQVDFFIPKPHRLCIDLVKSAGISTSDKELYLQSRGFQYLAISESDASKFSPEDIRTMIGTNSKGTHGLSELGKTSAQLRRLHPDIIKNHPKKKKCFQSRDYNKALKMLYG